MSQPGGHGLLRVEQGGMTVWFERRPRRCSGGHRFAPNGLLVRWLPCRCSFPALGHRSWLCRYVVEGRECGLIFSRAPA